MSYESQRGGVTSANFGDLCVEGQKDADATGRGSTSYPAAQDKPLMQVGTYTRPDCALDTSIFTTDLQNTRGQ